MTRSELMREYIHLLTNSRDISQAVNLAMLIQNAEILTNATLGENA